MKNVLVVDDSPMIRRIAKKILEELNFHTSEAEDGEKALVAVAASMPDAILLDWNMPVMDGLAFLVNLRQMPNGATPKVLVLHDRKRREAHHARDAGRRRRIHHEALQQADRQIEIRGSRPLLSEVRALL